MCLTARPPLGFHHTLTDTSNAQEQKNKTKLDPTLSFTPSQDRRHYCLAGPSPDGYKGLAGVLPVPCTPTVNLLMPWAGFIFQVPPLIIFSLWLSRKTHKLPNDPIQSQDLWGAKMALGQGHQRKGAIHLFHGLWLYKRKWSKWQLFITKSQEFKQSPRTIWIGGTQEDTQVRGAVYGFTLSGRTFWDFWPIQARVPLFCRWRALTLPCFKFSTWEKMWMKCRCLET